MALTENLTVMFTDIVGFTERIARQSRAESQAMLDAHDRLMLPLISRFGGRRIKSIGDALLVTFRSPTDAVRCGMAMHDALAEHNEQTDPGQQLRIRVALNVGEVRVARSDIFGEAVNVAARVEGLTPPGEIFFTEAVYLAMNKAEVPSAVVGIQELKGIPEPVKLFRVPPRTIGRLVPGGDELGRVPGELPFGGMHRLAGDAAPWTRRIAGARKLLNRPLRWPGARAPALNAPRPGRPWLLAALTGMIALGLYGVAAQRPEALEAAEPPAEPAAPTVQVAAVTAPAPTQTAASWLESGHAAFAEDRRPDAVAAYARALALDPGLREDPLLAERLVACLSWASEEAMPVIREYHGPAILEALGRRTAAPGEHGARRAARLLAELGHAGRIDPVLAGGDALAQAQTCEEKRAAIRTLADSGDARALPLLRATLGTGMKAWFANRCFRSDAEAAIVAIEQRQAGGGA